MLKMHFSVPNAHQFHDDNGISYMGYNIYINGEFHCTARYKQLRYLHEQLRTHHPLTHLPPFPPKRLFLTGTQLEERRVLLEKYLQLVGQNATLANSEVLTTFLFSAQQETHAVRTHEVDLQVYLMNGYMIPLSVSSTDTSDTILDIACNYINISKDLMKYFSLYLLNWSCAKQGQPALKKLENYESPYISQMYVRPEDKIVLRKSYWDPCYDEDLMSDHVTLDLLYLQLQAELDLGWMTVPQAVADDLVRLEVNKQKREYIEVLRASRHYGRVPAGEALTAGPAPGLGGPAGRVRVSLAGRTLALAAPGRELRYKVTRMRCWRVTTLHVMDSQPSYGGGGEGAAGTGAGASTELSFEYLVSKDNLQWVTLRTEHATHVSVMLQSMVEELMRQKSGAGVGRATGAGGGVKRGSLTYMRRDGSSQIITPSSSTDTLSSGNGDSVTSGSSKELFSVQKLAEKFASVTFKTGRDCVENNAFENIGDDDL